MNIDLDELKVVYSNRNMSAKLWATEWALGLWGKYGALKSGDTVVDLGCGERYAAAMSLDPTIRYIGFDVNQESIEACSELYPQYRWLYADLKNEMYNSEGKIDPRTFQFPIEDSTADLVICASLFTHLATIEVAENYLTEIRRMIKPGGHLWISWFRSPPNEVCSDARRTVFTEVEIINRISGWLELIFTTGCMSGRYHDQWVMLGKAR
ncbi:class I SAM-dependent methyltransferase [Gimesia maris]|uniref:class I SAM-dependent methyltransferase n=1 Tax=Gimesia maris TaxID=122 RepID=UPI0030DB8345